MKASQVKSVAVLGAGTMGVGIAQSFAQAGYDVNLFDINSKPLDAAHDLVRANLATLEKYNLSNSDEREGIVSRIRCIGDLQQAVKNVEIVTECVFEKKEIKQDVFAKLDEFCSAETIFASNTSYLNIFEVVPKSRQAQTVISHWFAPPHVVPLVEIVKGDLSSDETVECVTNVLEKVGKTPIVMNRFVSGFAINRILRILGREIFFLLDNGYMTAADLDKAVKASIAPRMMVLGLAQRYDFTGLDLSAGNLKNPDYLEPPLDNNPKSLIDLVEAGDLGFKSGRGFYDYTDDDPQQVLADRDDAIIRMLLAAQEIKPIGKPRA